MTTNYQADNIKSLDYFEHIRKYPGMYIGSKDSKGLLHCVKEIVSNSIDGYLNGAGNRVVITFLPNNGIRIEDNGRGIPHGKHPSGCSVLQACFGIANTGGKFDNATGESGYNTSGGEHGTGGKAVNALSKKMIVKTRREGLEEVVEFSKGQFISYNTNKIEFKETGTSVEFYPDEEVLETVIFDIQAIKDMVREFSFLCKGLTFIINNQGHSESFYSEKGLADYMTYLNPKGNFIAEPIYFSNEDGKFQLEVAIGYNSSYSSTIKLYTNNIPQEKGTHLTGFKTAWTMGLNNLARENKWLKEKDENLTGSDYEEGMTLILNFKMIDPVFKGQNKEELSSSEGRTYCQKLTTQALTEINGYYKNNFKAIIDKAINARKAREAAKKAREAVRDNKKAKKDKALKFDSKLADCYSKIRGNCEVYVVEGDSAAGNLKLARNNEFQAVMPIRGKIINVQKASLEKIQKNAEIMTMIEAFGLTVNPKTMKLTYDPSDLRYDKIIIAADADVDGSHIRNLFFTFIWNFCPELILDGHIYTLQAPLYRIVMGKDKIVYIRNDEELAEFVAANKGKKYVVQRFKGLGEMSAEETEETLTNPETRVIKQVTVDDIKATDVLFDHLMGTSAQPRKKFIQEHSKEATYGI